MRARTMQFPGATMDRFICRTHRGIILQDSRRRDGDASLDRGSEQTERTHQARSLVERSPVITRALPLVPLLLAAAVSASAAADPPRAQALVGYTEFRTDLPGGRHANVATMRAVVVRADGTGRRVVAEQLAQRPGHLDAVRRLVARRPAGHRRPRVGEPRERPLGGGAQPVPLQRRGLALRHGPRRPRDRQGHERHGRRARQLLQQRPLLLAGGPDEARLPGARSAANSHPFAMDRDGRNKRDLTEGSREFAYGFSASPDGRRIAYHKGYQVYRRRRGRVERARGRDGAPVQLRAAVVARRRRICCSSPASTTTATPTSSAPTAPTSGSSPTAAATGASSSSSTSPTSTAAAATSRPGRRTAGRSSTRPRSGRASSCSGPRSTAGASG